jgi:hypothetical protein
MDKHRYNNRLAPDTITTILENRFHLFPPPQLYEEQFKADPWKCKFYFGISKNKEGHFPEEGRIKDVAGRERFMFCFSPQPAPL